MQIIGRHPQLAPRCVDYVKQRLAQLEKDKKDCSLHFSSLSTLVKLDEGWVTAFVLERTRLTAMDLATMRVHENDIVKQLFAYMMNATMTAQVPAVCENNIICCNTCAARCAAAGERLKTLAKDGTMINDEGKVNWKVVGPYELKWSGEPKMVHQILHQPTGDIATIDRDDYRITQDFD